MARHLPMTRIVRIAVLGVVAAAAMLPARGALAAPCSKNPAQFAQWLQIFKKEAVAAGISPRTVNYALDGLTYDQVAIAKDRGITVSESRQDDSPIYESLIRITVTTDKGKRSFAGSVLAGTPRIIEVKSMDLDAPFAPTMLYVNNLDKPGFIGSLGALLADAGVNIATFNLGRVSAGEDAIALVGVDQEPAEALLAQIQSLPNVKEARTLRF